VMILINIGVPDDILVGRRLAMKPDLTLAARWLQDCSNSHTHCTQNSEQWLPSRVIDLGVSNSELCLRESAGLRGQYITLTHRWPSSQPYKTTSSNYADHLNRINYDLLPQTFRDAIEVTRSLKVQYLWIDALCIIQDSEDDWAVQCAEMPQIYTQSLLTIAGAPASEPGSGFLKDRFFPGNPPLGVEWPVETSGKKLRFNLVYQCIDHTLQALWNSKLATRAWILQERLMSQRILYFGNQMMHWECNSTQNYEPLSHWHEPKPPSSVLSKTPFEQLLDRSTTLEYWYKIVASYSSCELTKATDRFPAMSGLTRIFQQKLGDEYVAGLWRTDAARALNWHVPFHKAEAHASQVVEFIAPSWSWASVRQTIVTDMLEHSDSELEIKKMVATRSTQDDFGKISNAELSVSGRFHRATLVRSEDCLFLKNKSNLQSHGQPWTMDIHGAYYPDHGTEMFMMIEEEEEEEGSSEPLPEPDPRSNVLRDLFNPPGGISRLLLNNPVLNEMLRDDERRENLRPTQPETRPEPVQNNPGDGQTCAAPADQSNAQASSVQLTDRKEILLLCLGLRSCSIADWEWTALALESVDGRVNTYRRIGIARSRFDVNSHAEQWYTHSDLKATIDVI